MLGLCTSVAVGLVVPSHARADEAFTLSVDPHGAPGPAPNPRALGAPLAGAVTALAPLMVGSIMFAQDGSRSRQREAVFVMTGGFAAAPWVSHAVAGRWKRGVVFGLVSAAASAATLVAMAVRDPFDPGIGNHQRLAFGFLLTGAFLAGAAGVVDSFVVGPDAR